MRESNILTRVVSHPIEAPPTWKGRRSDSSPSPMPRGTSWACETCSKSTRQPSHWVSTREMGNGRDKERQRYKIRELKRVMASVCTPTCHFPSPPYTTTGRLSQTLSSSVPEGACPALDALLREPLAKVMGGLARFQALVEEVGVNFAP